MFDWHIVISYAVQKLFEGQHGILPPVTVGWNNTQCLILDLDGNSQDGHVYHETAETSSVVVLL